MEVTLIITAEITEVYKGQDAELIANDPNYVKTLEPKVAKAMKKRLGVDDFNIVKTQTFIAGK